MTPSTWVTMILTLTLVWGGFAFAILIALRKESRKRK